MLPIFKGIMSRTQVTMSISRHANDQIKHPSMAKIGADGVITVENGKEDKKMLRQVPTNKNRRFLRRVTPTCTIFIEVQADHGGMKITSCEILPAIVCYSSPEAKYGSLAVRNGNCRIWWKRFYMEPRSTWCKRFMSEWKRSRNVCHRARDAKT